MPEKHQRYPPGQIPDDRWAVEVHGHALDPRLDTCQYRRMSNQGSGSDDCLVAPLVAESLSMAAAVEATRAGHAVTVFEAWRQNSFDSAPAG